ncbi:Uncharacterised protein [Mycobacterium tuberculosis]|nr:Uncharacterised protein [Mycobacterium tuberculosis]CFR81057.1 Uncharacterised protein [Mycobacterium tuberculosis]CFS10861.1 Uncharacterised protein [Mycobacterium tuberculosis]CKO86472.1 Uncharacterised protein [Mycobacterium tuberculosis]CKS36319.1 Uncharacterised protein [Mycobacterium tuberculosis]
MRLLLIDNGRTAISPAAAYAPSSFHCRETIRPIRITNGNAKIARPYPRYTRSDCDGDSTPTISEMDFSSATHCGRVISELVITATR